MDYGRLVIRDVQIQALHEEVTLRWLGAYLSASYPDEAREMGATALRTLARDALREARERGFREMADLRKLAHATFLLGAGFSRQPGLRWAKAILDSPRFKDPSARLRTLEDGIVRHLKGSPPSPTEFE